MKTTGLDITRFMLDDAFWHGAATTDEAYLINGEHFTGNILLAKYTDNIDIVSGSVITAEDKEVPLAAFFSQWKAQDKGETLVVQCESSRIDELRNLLDVHGFKEFTPAQTV